MKNIVTIALAAIFVLMFAASAQAALTTQNCWGTVVSQRATTYGDIGTHSASQSEPRVGVGNLAHKIFDMSVGDLASLLGTLDDGLGQDPLGATQCP